MTRLRPIAPAPTTSPEYPSDSGVWRGHLTTRYANEPGDEPDRDDLTWAIHEANISAADELVDKLRAVNGAWLRSTLQDVPLSFTKNETGLSTQHVKKEQLSVRTERLAKAAERLSLALQIRRDDDSHPAVFGVKRKTN